MSYVSLYIAVSGLLMPFVVCPSKPLAQEPNLFVKLVEASKAEVAKKGGKITIATNWTSEQATPILDAYKKDFPFVTKPTFERVRRIEDLQRMLLEYRGGRTPAIDVTSVAQEVWPEFRTAGVFVKTPVSYREIAKFLPKDWPRLDPRVIDPEGYFLATSGASRGIAYNKNMVPQEKAPKSWDDCLNPMWRGKVVYDPRPKLTALQHDPNTRDAHLQWLKRMLDNQVVFVRGVAEGLEKVAAGEYPIFCGTNYHNAMPMIDEGAPLVFFLPDPFAFETAVQVFITKWSLPATTQLFALWTATKAQPIVDSKGYRGLPWVPGTRIYNMAKGKYAAICDPECLTKSADHYGTEHNRILGIPGSK
jgi:Bacterial extracellular solute-binding protein